MTTRLPVTPLTTVTDARVRGHDTPVDLVLADGLIADVRPVGSVPAADGVLDAAGRVVVPAFAESHLHLDKALVGGPPGGGTLAEAIAWTTDRKARMTAADIADRADRVLAQALSRGTTAVRAHTEVDPGIGLLGIETLLALAERWRDRLDVQLAVFPQEGIIARPGTSGLMREALAAPGTVVGACPYTERSVDDAVAHVRTVLDLAVELDRDVDLHLDLADDLADGRFVLAETVATETVARGIEGRVTIGHATTLAALDSDDRRRTFDALAEAGICVTALPATDLYLGGRQDTTHVRRGVAPIRDLWAAGVPVALSSNNLRNAFTPTGSADLLDIALLAARISHVSDRAELAGLLDAVTVVPGARLDPRRAAGIDVGAPADLVVLDSADLDAVLLDQPDRHAVVHAGRLVEGAVTGRAARRGFPPVG